MTDVWFEKDPTYSYAKDVVDVPDDIAALPNIKDYGILYDLHQAMARDPSGELRDLVEQFMAETDITARRALGEEIVYAWAGVRGDESMRGLIKTKKLVSLEKFLAEDFRQLESTPNAGPNASQLLVLQL